MKLKKKHVYEKEFDNYLPSRGLDIKDPFSVPVIATDTLKDHL